MLNKSKKKEVQKPSVFSTSSITRTENTITTANGSMRTIRTVQTSYQESRSSSTIGSTNFSRLTDDRSTFPKPRSAFNQPVHNYRLRNSLQSSAPAANIVWKPIDVKPTITPPLTPKAKSFVLPPTALTRKPLPSPPFQRKSVQAPTPSNAFNNKLNIPPLTTKAKSFEAMLPLTPVSQKPLQSPFQPNSVQTPAPNIFNNELNTSLKVLVKATGRFYDNISKVPTYQTRTPRKRGRLLLINNIDFKGKRRDGADVDQRNIVALFRQIGFEIIEHKNKKKTEIERIVKNFATDRDLKKCDICITVIMSHGTTHGEQTMIETIDELILPTEWVVQQFDGINCKYMNAKPKIFIFQCCRGESEHLDIQTDAVVFQAPRQVQDILISYSTIPGFVAYRNPDLGSWYIQGLCKVFMEHAHDTHIEDLLKIVDDELAKLKTGTLRQTSSYENRGFKKCYLHPIGN